MAGQARSLRGQPSQVQAAGRRLMSLTEHFPISSSRMCPSLGDFVLGRSENDRRVAGVEINNDRLAFSLGSGTSCRTRAGARMCQLHC